MQPLTNLEKESGFYIKPTFILTLRPKAVNYEDDPCPDENELVEGS